MRAHLRSYGYWCPGYQREPHYTKDLTADHITSRAAGGEDVRANLQVLCGACNSAKGA
jgi:5-methylcytosine-specific restriction endonuclease McrA